MNNEDKEIIKEILDDILHLEIKEIEYDNSGITPDPNVTFYLEEIEGNEIPEVDNLILNIDGCFYRVKSVSDEEIVNIEIPTGNPLIYELDENLTPIKHYYLK